MFQLSPSCELSADRLAPDRRSIVVTAISLVLVLALDSFDLSRSGEILRQLILGAVIWGVLIWLLQRATVLERIQVGIVVVLATMIEYAFSPGFEVYTYRLGTVPLYVPPGHGMVYLASLRLGQLPWVQQRLRALTWFVVIVGGGWMLVALFNPERPDQLGLFWFLCLLGFMKWGPSLSLYIGAFFMVTFLELLGTALGVWAWAPREEVLGLMSVGNPPSGSAGGYGWFDLYAILLSRPIFRWWQTRRAQSSDTTPRLTRQEPTSAE